MLLAFTDMRVTFLLVLQAFTRDGRHLSGGDLDQGVDLKAIRYGAKAKPEHALTPSHPFPEDLFTLPACPLTCAYVPFVQDLNETLFFDGQWCCRL